MNTTRLSLFTTLIALLLATAASAADTDGDGISDEADNCVAAANADQSDGDSDGAGNACDADYDNDGVVSEADLEILKAAFGSASVDSDFDPSLDHNGDGRITGPDFTTFIQLSNK